MGDDRRLEEVVDWRIKKKKSVGWIRVTIDEQLVLCFEPSQPLGITSGLKETFMKRHIVERTNKAEIRPEEQSEKTESCRETSWIEIQFKGP